MLDDLDSIRREMEAQSPQDILSWGWARFKPDMAISSSFQTQSMPLLHMITQVCPEMPVLFLDTGYHFPETLAFRDQLQRQWGLNIQVVQADPSIMQHLRNPNEALYERDPDLCCRIHKVEPMERALKGLAAWVSGIRRDQTAHRQQSPVIEQREDGLVRIHPMINWSKQDVWDYIERYTLPVHPLYAQGYTSIGCEPCTRPIQTGQDERAGRWAGTSKKECGLHTAPIPLTFTLSLEPERNALA